MFCSLNAIDCLKFRFVNNVIWRPDKRCFPHSALPHKNQPQLVITTCGRPIKDVFLHWITIDRNIYVIFCTPEDMEFCSPESIGILFFFTTTLFWFSDFELN